MTTSTRGALSTFVVLALSIGLGRTASANPERPRAPETTSNASIAVFAEVDTNPRRIAAVPDDIPDAPDTGNGDGDVIVVDTASDGLRQTDRAPPDALMRVVGATSLSHDDGPWSLRLDGAGGGKLFTTARSEHMAVAQGSALGALIVDDATALVARAYAKGRVQASGARSYHVLRGELLGQWQTDGGVLGDWFPDRFRLGGSGTLFTALDQPLFSSTTASVVGAVGKRFGRERLEFSVDAGVRAYPFAPSIKGGLPAVARRMDAPVVGSLSLTSARRIYVALNALGTRNISNSEGEAYSRLRGVVVVGTRLPLDLTLAAQGAIQLTRYDDGISLGQRYFLGDDDETQNMVDLTLSRRLFADLSVDARVAWYTNELNDEAVRFSRLTCSLGLRAILW